MTITFAPRISGGFTEFIIKNKTVSKLIDEYELTEKEAHDFVKSVLIAGFNSYEVNINDVINSIKDYEG